MLWRAESFLARRLRAVRSSRHVIRLLVSKSIQNIRRNSFQAQRVDDRASISNTSHHADTIAQYSHLAISIQYSRTVHDTPSAPIYLALNSTPTGPRRVNSRQPSRSVYPSDTNIHHTTSDSLLSQLHQHNHILVHTAHGQ